jgi:hypothetical protein
MQENDFGILFVSMLFKLVVASMAFVGVRIAISNMDKAFEISVKGWLNSANDNARALYFGLRLCAVCLLFGMVFSY